MTNKELNRDIKRMLKTTIELKTTALLFDGLLEKEFKRLYYADPSASSLNLKSLKIMMRLNQKYRFIAFHTFYISIDENKLL